MNAMTHLSLSPEKLTHEANTSQEGWPPSKTGGRVSGRLLGALAGNREAGWPDKALRPSLWTTKGSFDPQPLAAPRSRAQRPADSQQAPTHAQGPVLPGSC